MVWDGGYYVCENPERKLGAHGACGCEFHGRVNWTELLASDIRVLNILHHNRHRHYISTSPHPSALHKHIKHPYDGLEKALRIPISLATNHIPSHPKASEPEFESRITNLRIQAEYYSRTLSPRDSSSACCSSVTNHNSC